MSYTLFFISDYQFQKVFLCFLRYNFFTVFGGPLVVEAPGQLPSLPPDSLQSGPVCTWLQDRTTGQTDVKENSRQNSNNKLSSYVVLTNRLPTAAGHHRRLRQTQHTQTYTCLMHHSANECPVSKPRDDVFQRLHSADDVPVNCLEEMATKYLQNNSNEHRTAVMFQVILRQPLVALTSAQPEENLWQQMEEQALHLHYAFAVTQLTVSKHWRNSKKVLKK